MNNWKLIREGVDKRFWRAVRSKNIIKANRLHRWYIDLVRYV